jgi:tetraacyldisaccharide 4'-kinase
VLAPLQDWLQSQWWQAQPSVAAHALAPVAALYGALARRQRERTQAQTLHVPVVVVGNLIAGGAGKTPTVIATVAHLQSRGWTPGVISRGHGRRGHGVLPVTAHTAAQDSGDEPLLIHLRTGVPTWVGTDRVAAGRALLDEHPEVNMIVSDDGLQHHRLHRDVQVIVFDERGIGNGRLLPAGPLRESMGATPSPHSVVLYNAMAPTTAWPGHIAKRGLSHLLPLADWWQRRDAALASLAWQALRDRPIYAAAGIASPQRFFEQLRALGLKQLQPLPLPDHDAWQRLPWPSDARDVVITEKDAVKLRPERVAREAPQTQVWVAPLDFAPPPDFFAALELSLARGGESSA